MTLANTSNRTRRTRRTRLDTPRQLSDRDRSLARVASWAIEQRVDALAVPETIRQAVVVALLDSRSHGLDHPELEHVRRLPKDLAHEIQVQFHDTDTATLAQTLLEWDVREVSDDPREIPLTESGLPLALVPVGKFRHDQGAYFTPAPLVQALVDRAIDPWLDDLNQLENLTVLDPACGDGRFLVEIARRIWQRLEQPGKPNPEIRKHVIQTSVFGIDIDPLAVCQARNALWQAAGLDHSSHNQPDNPLATHLVTADGLLDPPPGDTGRFDLVIGNPPFGSFSGRGAVSIDPNLKTRYLDAWGTAGWNTLHGLFLRRSLELAQHTLALVLPTQVTHLAGYETLRTHVTDCMSLHHVEDHGESVFQAEAVAPVVTLVARRDTTGDARWNGACETNEPEWVDDVKNRSDSLGRLVGDPGVHTGNCSRELVTAIDPRSQSDHDGRVPVLEGRQVNRFACDPPAKMLRLDYETGPNQYFTIRPLETYRRAKFVIRQTARYPIVGPKHSTEYFRNSLLALFEPDNGCDVRYLVGLLNSQLIRFLYTSAVRESAQTSFPQVKVRSLRDLPIIWPDRNDHHQWTAYKLIVDSVRRLLELLGQAAEHELQDDELHEQETLEQQIDESVMTIYGLDQAARNDVLASRSGNL
jgi:SAM-dependent methyltransferase